MRKTYKLILISVLLFQFRANAQFPAGGGLGQIKNQLEKVGGKISKKDAALIVDKLYKEKILNENGRDIFKAYVLEGKTPEIFEKKPKTDSSSGKGESAKQMLSMLKGADSLAMNRAAFLVLLGVIDLHRTTYETARLMKAPLDKLKPILGEKWSFKPIIEGDIQNPFSFKVKMNDYRDDYQGLLESLNKTGILDPKVYTDCQKWLTKDERFVLKDFSIFLYAAVRSLYYDSYESLRKNQFNQIDTLQLAGLLNAGDGKALKERIQAYTLLNKTDIFEKLPNAITFRSGDVLEIPQKKEIIKRLFEQSNRLIPSLKISNLEIQEVAKEEETTMENPLLGSFLGAVDKFMDRRKLQISADFNGKKYTKEIPFNQIAEESMPDAGMRNSIGRILNSAWLGSKDIQILNDYLIDSGSKKRLFVIGDEFSIFPSPSREKRVVFLMDSTQYEIVKKQFISTNLSFGQGQDFSGFNSLSNLKKIYTDLLGTQLIEPMSEATIEKTILESRKVVASSYDSEILFYLLNQKPNRLVKGDIFAKDLKASNFTDFLNKMELASGKAFAPTELTENFDNEFKKAKSEAKSFKFGFKNAETVVADSVSVEPIAEDNPFAAMMGLGGYAQLEDKIVGLIKKSMAAASVKPYIIYKENDKYYFFLKDAEYESLGDKFIGRISPIYVPESYVTEVDTAYADPGTFDSESFVNELVQKGVVTEEDKSKIQQDLPNGIQYASQVIPYLKDRIEIDLIAYKDKSVKNLLADVYEQTRQKFFSDLKFDYLKIQQDSSKIGEGNEAYFEKFYSVNYGIDGKKYRNYFYGVDYELENIRQLIANGISPDSIYYNALPIAPDFFNAYLMDSGNQYRIVSAVNEKQKTIIVKLDENLASQFGFQVYGNANRNDLLNELRVFQEKKLIKQLNETEIEDFLIKYRSIVLDIRPDMMLIAADSPYLDYLVLFGENPPASLWPKSLQKTSNNGVLLEKFTDNYAEVKKKIEAEFQKEDEQKWAKEIEYKGEYTLKSKKTLFSIKLSKDQSYSLTTDQFFEKIMKPINAQLTTSKFYSDGEKLYFLTPEQKDFLVEKGVYFMD